MKFNHLVGNTSKLVCLLVRVITFSWNCLFQKFRCGLTRRNSGKPENIGNYRKLQETPEITEQNRRRNLIAWSICKLLENTGKIRKIPEKFGKYRKKPKITGKTTCMQVNNASKFFQWFPVFFGGFRLFPEFLWVWLHQKFFESWA